MPVYTKTDAASLLKFGFECRIIRPGTIIRIRGKPMELVVDHHLIAFDPVDFSFSMKSRHASILAPGFIFRDLWHGVYGSDGLRLGLSSCKARHKNKSENNQSL